jgi:hypothetical protein
VRLYSIGGRENSNRCICEWKICIALEGGRWGT